MFLVFANKQDVSGALTSAEISNVLSLTALKSHDWHIQVPARSRNSSRASRVAHLQAKALLMGGIGLSSIFGNSAHGVTAAAPPVTSATARASKRRRCCRGDRNDVVMSEWECALNGVERGERVRWGSAAETPARAVAAHPNS